MALALIVERCWCRAKIPGGGPSTRIHSWTPSIAACLCRLFIRKATSAAYISPCSPFSRTCWAAPEGGGACWGGEAVRASRQMGQLLFWSNHLQVKGFGCYVKDSMARHNSDECCPFLSTQMGPLQISEARGRKGHPAEHLTKAATCSHSEKVVVHLGCWAVLAEAATQLDAECTLTDLALLGAPANTTGASKQEPQCRRWCAGNSELKMVGVST